ncbi:L-histidine N(alpha)-methyltransferase [Actinophytocola xanthii]|nr:L-histidine N(alpha)-methyltransferase [Actinophytocola xanthii]
MNIPMWAQLATEGQADSLGELLDGLRRGHSTTGDGKWISSAFAYAGEGPADAWSKACQDRLYPVMRRSIESFRDRWCQIRSSLGSGPFNYVSLGPGDGQKDAVVLRELRRDNANLYYLPVDASPDMLGFSVRDLIVQLRLSSDRILALPWDFARRDNQLRLRQLLDTAFGGTPVLFSLLGNTLANFTDDGELLKNITANLLRSQDRLLLEVSTAPLLDANHAALAAKEYERSSSFGEFVISALRRYTDLRVSKHDVSYVGTVEGNRALFVKVIYRKKEDGDTTFTLSTGEPVSFKHGDTIRLLVTRKYAHTGIAALLKDSGLTQLASTPARFTSINDGPAFGMELAVLASNQDLLATVPEPTIADDLWRDPAI